LKKVGSRNQAIRQLSRFGATQILEAMFIPRVGSMQTLSTVDFSNQQDRAACDIIFDGERSHAS
jgi:hypothetical protein